MPTNLSGGLVGYGHYTGGTGMRQAARCSYKFRGKPVAWFPLARILMAFDSSPSGSAQGVRLD
ncbi:hypothetical protein KAT82_06375 [bacterium]|nr:hypothetical protein [bacterium]